MKTTALFRGAALAIAVVAIAGGNPLVSWAQDEPTAPVGADPFEVTLKPEPATLARKLRFQRLDRERGLPQNSVSSVVQDRTGFIWLGTQDGLARYDGQRFLTFRHDPDDPTSISASNISALLLAKDGTLWVGTVGGGVNRYLPDRRAFDRFMPGDEPDTLNAGAIADLAEGPDGRIWIGTLGGGLAVLDPATGKVRSYANEDGLPAAVSAVVVGADGTLWVGTSSGMYRMKGGKGGFELLFHDKDELKGAAFNALHLDREGNLWIGSDETGLYRYSPASRELKSFRADASAVDRLTDDSITAVYQDRAGRIWVGTQRALHTLDPATGRVERHAPDTTDSMALPGRTDHLFEDAAGVLWVGTFGGGAALLDPRSYQFGYHKTAGTTALFHRGKDLWASTSERLCRWRGDRSLEGVCYEAGFPTRIMVDRSGAVWVGTMTDGLLRLDPRSREKWTVYQHDPSNPASLAPGPVIQLHEDAGGDIWVGLLGGGLQRLDRARDEFTQYDLPSDIVYAIKPDPKDASTLWLGTGDKGIARLHTQTGEVTTYEPRPEDQDTRTDNAVTDFVFDGERAIWLTTFGGGLKRLDVDTGAFKTYRRTDGLPSDTLYTILRDPSGKLWLSSLAGLVRFDPKTEEIRVFGPADGVQSVEFAMGAGIATEDGRFVFGGINGFNVFDPAAIEIDTYRPPLVLTSVQVLDEEYGGGKPVVALEKLELAHDEGFVNVEFAALSYSGSDGQEYEYKIEGLNDRWFSSDSASLSLTGLEDGTYTLLVRARNRHGVETEPMKLGVIVAPPPWRTWWAYTGYGLILLAFGFSLYRYQKVRIERLEKMARLATVEREFEVTAAVQSWFLPESVSYSSGSTDLIGFYRGAEKCSGDWWWYEDLGEGKLWVIVADVTGHGAGPAMLTAAVAMGLSVQSNGAHESVVERLARVNKEVLIRCKGKATMTMTAVVIDQRTGEAIIYGMGGLPALLMGREGKHTVVGASGTPIGSAENLSVGERTIRMGPGDRLLITTDGIIETTLAGGRQLGFRRFVSVMREVREAPLPLAVNKIVHDVDLARGNQPQEDDFTFCMLERRG